MTSILQVHGKTTAARKTSSLHSCHFIFLLSGVSGEKNCQVWPSATPVSTCPGVYLQTAYSFDAQSRCKRLTDFLGRHGVRRQPSSAVANDQNKRRLLGYSVNINSAFKRAVSGVDMHFLKAAVNSQWRRTPASWRIPTRGLEVEAPKLNGVCGMVQRHFLAVWEAAFSGFRLCSFSTEQKGKLAVDSLVCFLVAHCATSKLASCSDKYYRQQSNYRGGRTALVQYIRLQGWN